MSKLQGDPQWLKDSRERPVTGASLITEVPTTHMDARFGKGDDIKIASVDLLHAVSLVEIQVWCVRNAVYQIPTLELIQWLRPKIAGKKAIEICAGKGFFGKAFEIPTTDSFMQMRPDIRAYYAALRTPVIEPPPHVEKLEAMEAVRKYEPEVVIASWATQLWKSKADKNASVHGVDEDALLDFPSVKTYIHIGNEGVHGDKRILRRPHKRERHPFLVSRAHDQTANIIYTWNV